MFKISVRDQTRDRVQSQIQNQVARQIALHFYQTRVFSDMVPNVQRAVWDQIQEQLETWP